ncbi:MAG: LamG-like jellyroll fold domain-containing protein, partial [Actinomycetota bacterium]
MATTVEAWFKTSAPGVVVGMQNTAYPAVPSSYVPVLYVGTDGKLRGEWWQGALTPITSATAVNNNAWHHAVLVSTGTSQTLYLDGVAVGTLAGTVNNLDMSYAQIGAGYTTSYPGVGAGWGHFSGSIDEVAIYQSSLTAAQVARHYASGKNGPVTTTSTYHPPTGAQTSPCGGSFVQAGLVKATTGPTGRVQELFYDNAGRPKATHLNADPWTCTSYDTRGRPTAVAIPAFGGEPARTVTSVYAVGGDPLKTSVADSAGTITATVDLLGRPVATTDVWNLTTTATYDQAGRLTDTTNPQETLHTDFDANGRVSAQKLGGVTVATPSYNLTTGELTGVAYGNGTSGVITPDAATGRTSQLAWSGPGGSIATDAVTYSLGGRVKDQTIDGADPGAGVN